MRTNAKAKGTGWGLIDIAAVSAVQMLILVEFATNDVQSVIGLGRTATSNSASTSTGSCDNVPNLTGRYTYTNGEGGIIYRGIENLWGNVWEWVDGVNINSGTYYVCNDPSKYADDTTTAYEPLSFAGTTGWSASYVTEEGLDAGDNKHVMLPSAAGSGSESTYLCDSAWSGAGWKVLRCGGYWRNGSNAGIFAVNLSNASSGSDESIGSRLMYIPQ